MDMTAAHSREANEKIDAQLKVHGLRLSSFIELLAEALQNSAVLDKLLAVQKLDHLGVEGAIHLYYNIVLEPCVVCRDIINTKLRHQYSFVHSLSLEESRKIVREYLIAATAKDCSLMISFKPADGGSTSTEYSSIFPKSCNQRFDYKANFIDLDLKPLDKMVHYYKLDQKIVDHYTKSLSVTKGHALLQLAVCRISRSNVNTVVLQVSYVHGKENCCISRFIMFKVQEEGDEVDSSHRRHKFHCA